MTATVRAFAEILRQEDSEQADSMRKCTEGQRVLLSLGRTQLETQCGDDAGKEQNILPQINSQQGKHSVQLQTERTVVQSTAFTFFIANFAL